ncbi:MAG: hypothetical protein QOE93_1259 [Actinomycetota bacterium]|nr:hypothetical protein [Actinomycetota bacterium]
MGPDRGWWATFMRLAIVGLVLVAAAGPALADPEDDLAAAQARANRAAADLAQAEEEMALAQDAVAHVQGRVAAIDARVGQAREQVRELAIRLYVDGTVPVIRILRMANANDVIRAQQYSHVVVGASTDALQQFRAERENLEEEQAALDREQESHADSIENLEDRRADAVDEIERLSQVLAEARAAREAELRAEADAAARAATVEDSSAGRSTNGAITATPAPAPGPAAAGPVSPGSTAPRGADPAPVPDQDPYPAPVIPDVPAGDWICPVQGPHAFSNDYGAPRGGGYTHQGNDILSPRGTPVVASVDGEVRHRSGAVSGLAYYLDGDDGNEYFGAHLDEFGADGRVTAGTVVGYVGNTGDAASTAPHLHFEIHPGGSGYENPYPTLVKYC